MIGYTVKIGATFYRIIGIEELKWSEETGSLDAGKKTVKMFDTYMQPLNNYIYFVESIGIDGNLGFVLEMPKGIAHGGPRGELVYNYFDEANPLDPMYSPFIITPKSWPNFALYNPTLVANNSDCYFFGQRWLVKQLEGFEIPEEGKYTELTNYVGGGIGQG